MLIYKNYKLITINYPKDWLRGWDLHPRPPGYGPGELLLLYPASCCII